MKLYYIVYIILILFNNLYINISSNLTLRSKSLNIKNKITNDVNINKIEKEKENSIDKNIEKKSNENKIDWDDEIDLNILNENKILERNDEKKDEKIKENIKEENIKEENIKEEKKYDITNDNKENDKNNVQLSNLNIIIPFSLDKENNHKDDINTDDIDLIIKSIYTIPPPPPKLDYNLEISKLDDLLELAETYKVKPESSRLDEEEANQVDPTDEPITEVAKLTAAVKTKLPTTKPTEAVKTTIKPTEADKTELSTTKQTEAVKTKPTEPVKTTIKPTEAVKTELSTTKPTEAVKTKPTETVKTSKPTEAVKTELHTIKPTEAVKTSLLTSKPTQSIIAATPIITKFAPLEPAGIDESVDSTETFKDDTPLETSIDIPKSFGDDLSAETHINNDEPLELTIPGMIFNYIEYVNVVDFATYKETNFESSKIVESNSLENNKSINKNALELTNSVEHDAGTKKFEESPADLSNDVTVEKTSHSFNLNGDIAIVTMKLDLANNIANTQSSLDNDHHDEPYLCIKGIEMTNKLTFLDESVVELYKYFNNYHSYSIFIRDLSNNDFFFDMVVSKFDNGALLLKELPNSFTPAIFNAKKEIMDTKEAVVKLSKSTDNIIDNYLQNELVKYNANALSMNSFAHILRSLYSSVSNHINSAETISKCEVLGKDVASMLNDGFKKLSEESTFKNSYIIDDDLLKKLEGITKDVKTIIDNVKSLLKNLNDLPQSTNEIKSLFNEVMNLLNLFDTNSLIPINSMISKTKIEYAEYKKLVDNLLVKMKKTTNEIVIF